jgi:hypothetical protein
MSQYLEGVKVRGNLHITVNLVRGRRVDLCEYCKLFNFVLSGVEYLRYSVRLADQVKRIASFPISCIIPQSSQLFILV